MKVNDMPQKTVKIKREIINSLSECSLYESNRVFGMHKKHLIKKNALCIEIPSLIHEKTFQGFNDMHSNGRTRSVNIF